MATAAILVNGLPGSGKSTISVKLSVLLGCPVLASGAVLESLADLPGQTVPGRRLGTIAMDTVWSLAAAVRDGVVVDSFWYSPRDRELALQGVAISGATRVVELWCDVAENVARERYALRERHDIHGAPRLHHLDPRIGDTP